MEISTEQIKELRNLCGVGIMECRSVLKETGGDMQKALQLMKERGIQKAEKRADRETSQGLVEAYVHTGGRIGALVEINCETDFVARTSEFKQLAHDLAMQVAALSPKYLTKEEIPAEKEKELDPQVACLMHQLFIKDQSMTIKDVVAQVIAKTGENIKVSRFARFELGTKDSGVC